MPVTKTAKRALRGSQTKAQINAKVRTGIEIAKRKAIKKPSKENVSTVFSLTDRAVKRKIMHKNKAAHIKSAFSKLLSSK